jgi:hypothetical protein
VIGKPSAEVEKPVPDTAAPVTVTAEFPVDVSVTDCVVAVFTATFPNARLAVLKDNAGACAPRSNAKFAGGPNALAVNVTICEALTGEAVALKLALFTPAATITVAGTATAELLLARFTGIPLLAGEAFSVTVQLSVAFPASEPFAQLSPVNTGMPAPFNFTIDDDPPEVLLVNVIRPVAVPAAAGLKPTLIVADCPGFRVNGKLAPDAVKPEPTNVSALIVTGSVPVDESVTGRVADPFTATLPKARFAVLTVSTGINAPSCRAKVSDVPAALAVSVAVSVELTGETVAVKSATAAPPATVTEAGIVTAALSLVRFTNKPPLGASALSVTLQESGADPVTALLVQLSELNVVVFSEPPVPLRPICIVGLLEELLVMISCPVAAPGEDGLNCTLILNVLWALTVAGRSAGLAAENDWPVTAICEISTGTAL